MVTISGDNLTVPGQITLSSAPTASTHVVRRSDMLGWRAISRDVDLHQATPADAASVVIPSSKFLLRRVLFCNATADLSAAIVDIRDAAAGAGNAAVAAETLSGLSAAATAHLCTVDLPVLQITTGMLYVRLTTTAANAGTADLVVEYEDISDL